MEKGFYPTIFGLILLCVVVVSSITYYKLQKGIKEGWSLENIHYDQKYTGGLGWSGGHGNWQGKEGMTSSPPPPPPTTTPKSNYKLGDTTIAGSWVAPGWSVLWEGDEEGGIGVDQVFHKTSLEGEFDFDSYPPSKEDTYNRLGGGWKLDNIYSKDSSGNSSIYPTAPPDDSYGKINGDLSFYAPGTFMYGADNYVPSYASSVLLSPMLGVNAPLKPVVGEGQGGTPVMVESVCSPGSGASVIDKESYCQKLTAKEAGEKECCVVLGSKQLPMAGNDQGPYNRSIYTNPIAASGKTDYYMHLDKCYGNCPVSSG